MIDLQKKILTHLKNYKKATIPLIQLTKLFAGDVAYQQFASAIRSLIAKGILKPVLAHGTNGNLIPLHNTYRINKQLLYSSIVEEIQHYGFICHPEIKLNSYFSLATSYWLQDLPLIEKIDLYLKENGLPNYAVTSPERSLELWGDEKWIDEGGGRGLLERIGLWEKLKIADIPDPLMLAVNPHLLANQKHQHLIVENKAIFYALLHQLENSFWSSLVFGSGWKIIANLTKLEAQLGLQGQAHVVHYFGDLDPEGISIWYALQKKYPIKLALSFYQALLQKPPYRGKENQQKNKVAIEAFQSQFPPHEREILQNLLYTDHYYPQEALTKEEVQKIWRQTSWKV